MKAGGQETAAASGAGPGAATPSGDLLWGVSESACGYRWRHDAVPMEAVQAMATAHDLPEALARILIQRGIAMEEVPGYLEPTLKDLMPDPSTLAGMDRAAERLADAIAAREAIGVFADYDVDGATSSSLMIRFLRALGIEARLYVPDRLAEGYGPNGPALRALAGEGMSLVITLDCGITAFDALEEAANAGLDILVIDHHQAEAELPRACAVVNPNRQDDSSGLGHLAAVGVTFMTLVAVMRTLRARGWFKTTGTPEPRLLDWLDIVALGTVCDVVPLTGLNRAFVVQGLKVMGRARNIGLAALSRIAGLSEPPGVYHLGFVLGPRVNAGGRVGKSDLGAQLLSTEDDTLADTLARELDGLNQERRAIEQEILEAAMAQGEAQVEADPECPVLIVRGEGWHPGVIGIVASRLKDRFERPVWVLAEAEGIAKGSGRSLKGVDLGAGVLAAREAGLLVNGGGHAMAAGLTIETARIDDFTRFLGERLADDVMRARAERSFWIDATVSVPGASRTLFDALQKAGPYGAGNREPRVAVREALLQWVQEVGDGHLRCTLATPEGARLPAIAFRVRDTALGQALLAAQGTSIHAVGHLRADNYKGRNGVQLHLEDIAPCAARPDVL